MLNSSAVQKLETPNPSISLSANNIISAFITNRKRPNVTIVAGMVKMTKIGLTNRFNMASTMATQMAPV